MLDGTTVWRCRSCRERFFLHPSGAVDVESARSRPAASVWRRLGWVRRLRRGWHNSYRWRLQHGRRLMRRAAMVVSLFALVALFLLALAHYSGRATE